MSNFPESEHSHDLNELQEQLADTEWKLIEANINFVSSIPEWATDPVNHERIFLVLTSLPSTFFEQQKLQSLLLRALGSLPPGLLNKYLAYLSGANPSEQQITINLLSSLDRKYANDLDAFLKVELSKMHHDGYKGNLLDGHSLEAIESQGKSLPDPAISKSKPIKGSSGVERSEYYKHRFKAQCSEAFQKFVITSAYHFEAFMQALAVEKGLEGAWDDEFPSIGQRFQRFTSGKISMDLSEHLHSIFTDACNKASFEIFKDCQQQQD